MHNILDIPKDRRKEFFTYIEGISNLFDELGIKSFDSFIDDKKRRELFTITISKTPQINK